MKRLVLLAMFVLAIGIFNNIMSGDSCYIIFLGVVDKIPGHSACGNAFLASIAAGLGMVIVLASYVISLIERVSKK